MRKGFTLIEMLVVIGIIAALIAASIGSYSAVTKTAKRTKCRESVAQVATALALLYQQEGNWPKRLALQGKTDGKLDAETAVALKDYYSIQVDDGGNATGFDKFGIITSWALDAFKRAGNNATLKTGVSGSRTIDDHIFHFAIDLDGDGIIKGAMVGGASVDIRATAAVWCCGADGVIDPYPYAAGGKGAQAGSKSDDIYSWTPGQARGVQ